MTVEALRIRAFVFLAPVSLLLELGRQLRIALGADSFRDSMLDAPVAVEIVAVLSMVVPAFGRDPTPAKQLRNWRRRLSD